MNAYALFFLGCGAIGVPALVLFGSLTGELPDASMAVTPGGNLASSLPGLAIACPLRLAVKLPI